MTSVGEPGYLPYCGRCTGLVRMARGEDAFVCRHCGLETRHVNGEDIFDQTAPLPDDDGLPYLPDWIWRDREPFTYKLRDEPRVIIDLCEPDESVTCRHLPAPHLNYIETPKPLSKRAKRRAKATIKASSLPQNEECA